MVSDFIDECNGFLALSDEEFALMQKTSQLCKWPEKHLNMVQVGRVTGVVISSSAGKSSKNSRN